MGVYSGLEPDVLARRTPHDQVMTTNDAPADAPPSPPPGPPSPPPGPPAAPERKLTRTNDGKMIAGVCGGLGRYTGVDPVVFRIGLAVLVFFGGVGAVIYLAAWLFLPADGDTASPAEAVLGRGQSSTSTVLTAILAVIGVVALGFAFHGESALLLALVVLGIVLLARRDPLPPGPAMAAAGANPDVATDSPAPPVPPPYAPYGPYGGSVGGQTMPIATMPTAPAPPKPRSALGRIVLSATLLVLGLMLVADQLLNVSIPAPGYVAAALAMIGAGLVVGTWFGRSRWLIALGVALCIALPVTTAASNFDPDTQFGNQRWAPVAAADIAPMYDIAFGDATLDLTGVDFADASTRTRLEVGFGHLLVRVPSDVDVTVRGQAGAGNINFFGEQTNGNDISRTVTDLGADGAGGGTLHLNVSVGFGELEVLRG